MPSKMTLRSVTEPTPQAIELLSLVVALVYLGVACGPDGPAEVDCHLEFETEDEEDELSACVSSEVTLYAMDHQQEWHWATVRLAEPTTRQKFCNARFYDLLEHLQQRSNWAPPSRGWWSEATPWADLVPVAAHA
jgi:hypothetical protein